MLFLDCLDLIDLLKLNISYRFILILIYIYSNIFSTYVFHFCQFDFFFKKNYIITKHSEMK